jgi:hypothetical protein
VPRTCTICTHPQREEIDRAIARKETYRKIAERYSVTTAAVHRHAKSHLPQAVQAALEAEVVERGASILSQVRELYRRARELMDEAALRGRYSGAAAFLKEARELLILKARLLGELDTREKVEVHNYLDARTLAIRIARELEDEPELAERVGRILMELTDGR